MSRNAASKGKIFGMDADLIGSMFLITEETPYNIKEAYVLVVQCKVKGKKKQ